MELPKDTSLPFFAYGLFEPGQLAFYKIHDLVNTYYPVSVKGRLRERDGLPIFQESDFSRISGVLINFKDDVGTKAYGRIASFEPERYYRWEEVFTIDKELCNALIGIKPDKGTSDYEGRYDGKKDPYFSVALEEIKSILKESKRENIINDPKPFFRLQMAYMLLWTSIERYVGMRYNLKEIEVKKSCI